MRETIKSKLWVKYFTDKSSPETFGNSTKSAIKAYGYDKPEQYHLASITGSNNMRKYEHCAQMICDLEGFGYAELVKIMLGKAIKGSYDDMERFMTFLGYLPDKPATQINIQQNHFDFNDIRKAIEKSSKERGLPSL